MFYVTKTTGNGYQCGCCKSTSERTKEFQSRAEALAEVPLTIPANNCDGHLEGIEVKDGSDGSVIASVSMWFSSGYGRGSAYKAQRWKGYVFPSEGEPFIEIDDVRGKYPTWDECIAKIKAEYLGQQKREAERELEAAQKKLARVEKESQS